MDTQEKRALEFLNKAKEPEDLVRHYLNGPEEVKYYIIGSSISKQVFELRETIGGRFSHPEQLLEISRFSEKKLILLYATFEDDYLKMTGELDDETGGGQLVKDTYQQLLDISMNKVLTHCFGAINTGKIKARSLSIAPINVKGLKLASSHVFLSDIKNPLKITADKIQKNRLHLKLSFYDEDNRFQLSVDQRVDLPWA